MLCKWYVHKSQQIQQTFNQPQLQPIEYTAANDWQLSNVKPVRKMNRLTINMRERFTGSRSARGSELWCGSKAQAGNICIFPCSFASSGRSIFVLYATLSACRAVNVARLLHTANCWSFLIRLYCSWSLDFRYWADTIRAAAKEILI